MRNKGITLIELTIVVTIIGILAVALGFEYIGWMGKYRVEKTTKDLFSDIMDVRSKALTRGRTYFVDFNTPAPAAGEGCYRVIEDTNGDATLNNGDTIIIPPPPTILPLTNQKTVKYVINWNGGGEIGIDRRGIIANIVGGVWMPITTAPFPTIQVVSTVAPDYDCIIVEATRLSLGQWNTATGVCDAK